MGVIDVVGVAFRAVGTDARNMVDVGIYRLA